MNVQLTKRLRYGTRIFEAGAIGTVVVVTHPLIFQGKPIYDFYVRFDNHKPIGVFKTEVEQVQ